MSSKFHTKKKVGVVGLGYVGLPLAVNLARNNIVIGIDRDLSRIESLSRGIDLNQEIANNELSNNLSNMSFHLDFRYLIDCEVIFVCIPTPIDNLNNPDLQLLKLACEEIGDILKPNQVIVFESTVYPGCTEEFCMPILSHKSGIPIDNLDIAYSPERINPGDSLDKILLVNKIISSNNSFALNKVKKLYEQFLKGNVIEVNSIKIAEMAKIIENVQRDLNIALINEVSIICNLLEIDTRSVLDAAETKWNFIRFNPGLVGGHCIGVDPYYLAAKAKMLDYHPQLILAARHLNNSMSRYIADRVGALIGQKNLSPGDKNVLVLGFSFKPNVSDTRNTKVYDLVKYLIEDGFKVDVFDPKVDILKNKVSYPDVNFLELEPKFRYDVIIGAVAHKEFLKHNLDYFNRISNKDTVFFEFSNFFPQELLVSKL